MRRLVAAAPAALLALAMAGPVSAAKFQISVDLNVPQFSCFVTTTATWSAIPLNARTWTFNFTTNGSIALNIDSGTVPPRGGSAGDAGNIVGTGLLGSRIDFMDSQGRIVYTASSTQVQVDCI